MNNLKRLKNYIFNGLSYILFGNFLSQGVALISSILIARLVDKSEYAYLSYADNLYQYIALFTGLGLGSALLVVCTTDVSQRKQYAYLNSALIYGGAFEFAIALLLCICAQFINIPFLEARKYIWMLWLYPLITYLFNALQSYIRVKRNNKLYAGLGAIQTVVVCIASVALVIVLDAMGVVFARYIAVILVLIMAAKYLLKTDGRVRPEKLTPQEKKHFMGTGIALMLANLFSGMMPINEAFIVNNLIKDEITTANFKVAGIIPSMLPIITSSVMIYFFPIIASMRDGNEIRKKVYRIALINGVIVVIATVIGVLLTPFGISFIYGNKYADAAGMSYALWIMRCINAVLRMVPLNILAAIGESKFTATVSTFTCIAHAVLDYWFISTLGINGIAYATIIVYVLSGIVMWQRFKHKCNLISTQ